MTEDEIKKLVDRVDELEKFRQQVDTGRKVGLWVLATIGGMTIFFLTLFEKLAKVFKGVQ